MRKTLLLTVASLFVFFSSQAQITKGAVLPGGSFSFNGNETRYPTNGGENRSLYFSPSLGFALRSNRVFGFDLGYSKSRSESSNNPQSVESQNFSAGIFLTRYFPIGKSFFFTGTGSLRGGVEDGSREYTSSREDISGYSVHLGLSPGVSYAISRKVLLESSLGSLISAAYSKSKTNTTYPGNPGISPTESKSTNYGIHLNLDPNTYYLNVGIRFILGK